MNNKIERLCRYTFNDKELLEKAKLLAEAQGKQSSIEADKKRVTSEFNARMEEQSCKIETLGECVRSGYELRNIICTVDFDTPEKGKKTIRRDDNYEVVEVCDMTNSDRQFVIKFEKGEE